jgi:cation-transporting ATPase 13A1
MSLIASISLLQPRPFLTRLDTTPFLLLYCVLFYLKSIILIPIALAAHLLLFMLARSFMSIHSVLSHVQTSSKLANKVLVQASKNSGRDRVVDMIRTHTKGSVSLAESNFEIKSYRFEFQKIMFSYDDDTREIKKLEYPSNGTVSNFLSSTGLSASDVTVATIIWGLNEFDIPMPGFLDLYFEHLIAPFFVFQVVCLVLWSLDDYWYYSVLTLLMLMFFEGMMCKQRLNSLEMLRNMRRPPMLVYVFRAKSWVNIMSDQLVPGDVVSLKSGKKTVRNYENEENIVPCDVVLIRGKCVVNEAMLTGESVPQMKESLSEADDKSSMVEVGLDSHADAVWRRHIVFGGTTFLQHTDTISADETGSSGQLPPPPDRGCVGVVVRTAFGSSQGDLMRKILFATERVNTSSMETVFFIAVMVCFAVVAAGVVLYYGLQDDTRNKFKLFLHCIMIVTSVVPPELPMELSLSVTNSLAALARGLVFCTGIHPFFSRG